VEIVFSIGGRAAMLRDGRADVGLLHRPQNDLTGLDAEELFTERQVVVLPGWHRLAQLPAVCMADLAGETMPRWPRSSTSRHVAAFVRAATAVAQRRVLTPGPAKPAAAG
jgi:DNA-binding transcriptional LysR family regulator